jgi:predicted RNA-binding Zn-ribbon protein involved in translation (DUF1610 family)
MSCVWKKIGSSLFENLYETDCGQEFDVEGYPEESGWFHCPHCGETIEVTEVKDEQS